MNKEFVIVPADAIVKPETVMIEFVTASITRFAMFCIILNN
jgi:hypothetical protein